MTLEIFVEPQGGVHFKVVVEPHGGPVWCFSVTLWMVHLEDFGELQRVEGDR